MNRFYFEALGEQLLAMCKDAEREIILVAPFIKSATLSRILERIPLGIGVCCVTRWRPDEILAGASDLEVWPLLRERENCNLFLRDDLHAKYYRIDNSCLIGSANITNSALGWAPNSNLEILVPLSSQNISTTLFEQSLLASTLEVSESLYVYFSNMIDELRLQVADQKLILPEFPPHQASSNEVVFPQVGSHEEKLNTWWIPKLRQPAHLYEAYKQELDGLSTTTRQDALIDLTAFELPGGLSKVVFRLFISWHLLQMPIVQHVDKFVSTPQRFGAVRNYIKSLPCAEHDDFDATHTWQTLMRWLVYFLADRYEVTESNYSEVIRKRSKYN